MSLFGIFLVLNPPLFQFNTVSEIKLVLENWVCRSLRHCCHSKEDIIQNSGNETSGCISRLEFRSALVLTITFVMRHRCKWVRPRSFTPIKIHLQLMLLIDKSVSPETKRRANTLNGRDLIKIKTIRALCCLIQRCASY